MTTFVNASGALRWCFRLDGSVRAEQLLLSGERLIAPDLVIAEIVSAVWKFVTRGGMMAEAGICAVRKLV
jgi:predicted nucleic acid-binding protein